MGEQNRVKREERVAAGVSIRRNASGIAESIRISFMFRQIECRERLTIPPTPPNIQYAIRLRGEIINAIERQTFNYADYFPDSKNATRFGSVRSDLTMGERLRLYREQSAATLEQSTFRGYARIIDGHLIPWFEKVRVRDLTPAMIREKLATLDITMKTARNICGPLNAVLQHCITDNLIEQNPLDRVILKHLIPRDRKSDFEVDPFCMAEITAILDSCDGEERNFWQFAFATGMRPGERIALAWPRVDFKRGRIEVIDNQVSGLHGKVMKQPKTAAGIRFVDMLNGAHDALIKQQKIANDDWVFHDPRYNAPWENESVLRKRWVRILKRAGVRYRNPYQTRHTFASTLLSAGVNPLYVARQMGHKTTEMIQRHYGRWIDQADSKESRGELAWFFGAVSHLSPTAEVITLKSA